MIYVDSSAIVKLVLDEEHSPELRSWLGSRGEEHLVTSALSEVEVPRAVLGARAAAQHAVPAVLQWFYRHEIDGWIRSTAASLVQSDLRTLDAIHLATALSYPSRLSALISYDSRLVRAARQTGLQAVSP